MDTTQHRLLNAAGAVFAEKGFEAATVREICRQAEVANLAAVNYYYGDKEALYIAAVKQAFVGPAEEPWPSWPEDTPPAVRLRGLIRHFVRQLIGDDRPAWHMQLIGRELTQPSAACLAFVRDYARPFFQVLLDVLGEFLPAEVALVKRHLFVISIIGQCVHHRCARTIITQMVGTEEARTYDAELLGDHIADFSLAALGLTAPCVSTRA